MRRGVSGEGGGGAGEEDAGCWKTGCWRAGKMYEGERTGRVHLEVGVQGEVRNGERGGRVLGSDPAQWVS
jgi:hypothetical protein